MKRFINSSLLLVSLAAGLAVAQPGQEEEIENPFSQKDPREEMTRLFHKVERTLDSISDALYEAGAGGGLEEIDSSGLHELLKNTGSKSSAAVEDIDRILKLAEQMSEQSQSSSGGGSPPTGDSPLDGDTQGGPRQREGTPQGPRPGEEEGEGPEEKPGGHEGDKPEPGGEKPDGNQKNPDEGDNRSGDPNDPESGDAVPRANDQDKWGMLPERVRSTFQNQGGEELPAQYRDWIDAYYRRLGERQ